MGFILLGLVQAIAIRGYVQSAWWWALALAWVPPYLLLLGYTTLIGDFAGAALPDATTSYRTVVGEALLLITPLGLFWLLARHPKPTAPRPRGYVDSEPLEETATQPVESGPQMRGVLLLPLAVAGAALALYWLAYTSLVERTWIEPGDATYLRFAADRIVTAPQQDEQWDKQQLLADSTLDGAIRVRLVSKLEIYSGADANSTKSFNVENLNKNRVGRTKINIVRLSPDGKLVATGTGAFHSGESAWYVASDHAVHIWSLADGAELYQLTEPHAPVHAIAWSPDGRYLAAGSGLEDIEGSWAFSIDYDPVVRVWLMDGAKPELVKVFTGHSDAIEALAWSEDSRHLASRDLDNRIVVWKVS